MRNELVEEHTGVAEALADAAADEALEAADEAALEADSRQRRRCWDEERLTGMQTSPPTIQPRTQPRQPTRRCSRRLRENLLVQCGASQGAVTYKIQSQKQSLRPQGRAQRS